MRSRTCSPISSLAATLEKVGGRGRVAVAQLPTAANGYTLIVNFTHPEPGAAWCHARLTVMTIASVNGLFDRLCRLSGRETPVLPSNAVEGSS